MIYTGEVEPKEPEVFFYYLRTKAHETIYGVFFCPHLSEYWGSYRCPNIGKIGVPTWERMDKKVGRSGRDIVSLLGSRGIGPLRRSWSQVFIWPLPRHWCTTLTFVGLTSPSSVLPEGSPVPPHPKWGSRRSRPLTPQQERGDTWTTRREETPDREDDSLVPPVVFSGFGGGQHVTIGTLVPVRLCLCLGSKNVYSTLFSDNE